MTLKINYPFRLFKHRLAFVRYLFCLDFAGSVYDKLLLAGFLRFVSNFALVILYVVGQFGDSCLILVSGGFALNSKIFLFFTNCLHLLSHRVKRLPPLFRTYPSRLAHFLKTSVCARINDATSSWAPLPICFSNRCLKFDFSLILKSSRFFLFNGCNFRRRFNILFFYSTINVCFGVLCLWVWDVCGCRFAIVLL